MELTAELKAKHFLVVDDYESMRTLIVDQLKKIGVTKITVASSGNNAIKKIMEVEESNPVQYVLADLMMEDGNGIELAAHIRQKLNKKNLPILMITSKSEISYVLDAVKAGVNSYLIKPWEEKDFIKKLVEADKK